ncbi:hypothetical protein O0I10_004670 [Lichtheimia ornata]|uniref:Uncharacterized protein n=1 Tax=Lichtheimia ornata TaxID=688661 RepID=A0AAD7Y093_9FUNG|nr:uncharacterized protein O0I10_004670 [Lichtheimia ornata]KAJ8659691.1 hypothetical protein O0I10_004670 [Lichtheimia ornata]
MESIIEQRKQQPPSFVIRLMQLTWTRIRESPATKIYTTAVVISSILGIVLEILIAVAHRNATNDLWQSISEGHLPSSPFSPVNPNNGRIDTLINLRRLMDENVFFILFYIFQLYLGIDAVVRQSVIQLVAHAGNSFICVILALVQLGETLKWNHRVSDAYSTTTESIHDNGFYSALHCEIALASLMAVITCIFTYICFKLIHQFGWNTYKRIGADPKLQRRFKKCQLFLLSLKLDGFFHIVFSIFWVVVMTQEGYHQGSPAAKTWYSLHFILTVVQFPAPFVARQGLRTERSKFMIPFLVLHALLVIDFIIILQQSSTVWTFWVLAVCLAIVLSLGTIVLGAIVTHNFGKGLKPYTQRLFDKNYRYRLDPTANPTFLEKNNQKTGTADTWAIDDDIDEYEEGGPTQRDNH